MRRACTNSKPQLEPEPEFRLKASLVVADSLNYRVQQWAIGEAKGAMPSTIAGGTRGACGPLELGQPMEVAVDAGGVLYVADSDHGRVQRYPLETQGLVQDAAPRREREHAERILGKCLEYRAGGYGFVKSESGIKHFVHHSDLREGLAIPGGGGGYPALAKGQKVSFEPRRDAKWGWRCALVQGEA